MALLKVRASLYIVIIIIFTHLNASVCSCVYYKHGNSSLGIMHRASSFSERASKMISGHVALCHLGHLVRPPPTAKTVTHSLPQFPNSIWQKKYTFFGKEWCNHFKLFICAENGMPDHHFKAEDCRENWRN